MNAKTEDEKTGKLIPCCLYSCDGGRTLIFGTKPKGTKHFDEIELRDPEILFHGENYFTVTGYFKVGDHKYEMRSFDVKV